MASILVIDDDEGIRKTLNRRITKYGHQVFLAESGMKGIDIARKRDIDVILIDQSMPGMDGLRTFGILTKEHPTLPAVMMTAHGSLDLAVAFMKAGGFDFIQKPIDIDILMVKIRQTLEARRIRTERDRQKEEIKKLEFLKTVATTLGHEINNPLQNIATANEVWAKKQGKGDSYETIAQGILRIKAVTHKLCHLSEVKIVEYAGESGMIDLEQLASNDL